MRFGLFFAFFGGLMGCALPSDPVIAPPVTDTVPVLAAPAPPEDARRVDEFDTTTEAQRIAAATPAVGGQLLGNAVLTLGDPTRPGCWVETTRGEAERAGRVELIGGNESVEGSLFPGDGSGRISLAALRVLEVALTALIEVEVYADQ